MTVDGQRSTVNSQRLSNGSKASLSIEPPHPKRNGDSQAQHSWLLSPWA
ncbi:MAG: hypothetical protein F6K26_04135 [Moorea sp. SIO2I5]|nr:hypothetical protein [Moorena sp. SIO2I5]